MLREVNLGDSETNTHIHTCIGLSLLHTHEFIVCVENKWTHEHATEMLYSTLNTKTGATG